MKKILSFLCTVVLLSCSSAQACTLWSANGSTVRQGGTLIVKNRDWRPDHKQILRMIIPETGYRYMGIYAMYGKSSHGLKAGINEKGLVIVTASASSIPAQERKTDAGKNSSAIKHPYEAILRTCSTVEDVLKQERIFAGPQFIMAADKTETALLEIGPDGHYAASVEKNGYMYHTNHYVLQSMTSFNKTAGISSLTRYDRIGELLGSAGTPFTLDTFSSFAMDQHDGPDNSILRTGSTPGKTRTLATWAVYIPEEGSPVIRIRLMNPRTQEQTAEFTADDVFSGKENALIQTKKEPV